MGMHLLLAAQLDENVGGALLEGPVWLPRLRKLKVCCDDGTVPAEKAGSCVPPPCRVVARILIYERKSPSRSQNAGAGLVPRTGSHPRRGGVDPEKRIRGTITWLTKPVSELACDRMIIDADSVHISELHVVFEGQNLRARYLW